MKFNMPSELPSSLQPPELRVGSVYISKMRRKTDYWIVIGINGDSVYMVGINREGEMTGVQSYGRWVLAGDNNFKPRAQVGFCPGLADLAFDVELFEDDLK